MVILVNGTLSGLRLLSTLLSKSLPLLIDVEHIHLEVDYYLSDLDQSTKLPCFFVVS